MLTRTLAGILLAGLIVVAVSEPAETGSGRVEQTRENQFAAEVLLDSDLREQLSDATDLEADELADDIVNEPEDTQRRLDAKDSNAEGIVDVQTQQRMTVGATSRVNARVGSSRRRRRRRRRRWKRAFKKVGKFVK